MLVTLTALFVVALAAPVLFRWTGRQGFYLLAGCRCKLSVREL